MKDYDKIIINELLSSYERSTLYKGRNERNISIDYKFSKKNIPEYFDQTSTSYEDIHMLMQKLEEQSLIKIHWKNNKVNHVITKVLLNTDELKRAYDYAGRKQLITIENQSIAILKDYAGLNEITANFCNWAVGRIEEGRSVKKYIDIHDTCDLIDLLKGIAAVSNNSMDYYIRELSILLYKDSKKLESLTNRIEAVIREFHPDAGHFTGSYDILQEYNISRNPTLVMLKGAGSLHLCGSRIELMDFENGIGLSGKDLQNISFTDYEMVKRVITIENLTAFNRFNDSSSLIIYLAGFHNTARRELLMKVYRSYANAEFFHWGDIDAGGFRIYLDLCKKTGIPFKMLWMNSKILYKYKDYTKKLTGNDKKELKKLLESNDFSEFGHINAVEIKETIKNMLKYEMKLEQEIINTDLKI